MRAKFIEKYPIYEYGRFIGYELKYEYRGHKYTIFDNRMKGYEPLSWQHRENQDSIDRLIEIEETSKSMKHNENASSIDEVLNELLNFWDS